MLVGRYPLIGMQCMPCTRPLQYKLCTRELLKFYLVEFLHDVMQKNKIMLGGAIWISYKKKSNLLIYEYILFSDIYER